MKNTDIYVAHILDAVKRIQSYTHGKTMDDFHSDTLLQDAVVRNLEIIGEASKKLPPEFTSQVSLPWLDIGAMRNKIVHDYFEVDLDIIWHTVLYDLAEVERALTPYFSRSDGGGG